MTHKLQLQYSTCIDDLILCLKHQLQCTATASKIVENTPFAFELVEDLFFSFSAFYYTSLAVYNGIISSKYLKLSLSSHIPPGNNARSGLRMPYCSEELNLFFLNILVIILSNVPHCSGADNWIISQKSFTSGSKHQNWHRHSLGATLLKKAVSHVKIQDGGPFSRWSPFTAWETHISSHNGTPWTDLDDLGVDSYVSDHV